MGDKENYEEKLPEITAIKDNDIVKYIRIPIAIYIQEAGNLYNLCQKDKKNLFTVGFDWKIVEDIPIRIGALREAETRWYTQKFIKQENRKKWKEKVSTIYKLRNFLLHKFCFAYRKDQQLKNSINIIAKNQSYAAIIQDINDLAYLGKENPKPLHAINFELTKLDDAIVFAKEMATLYATVIAVNAYNNAKKIRNQAYTYLKIILDEVYEFGQHIFWKDLDKRKKYTSLYLRKHRKKQKKSENNKE